MRLKAQTVTWLAVITAAMLLIPGCAALSSDKLVIVGSTAHIAVIARRVGGDRVEVATIAPAGMCPGHFDLRPSDVAAVNRAHLLINHGWEAWFSKLEGAISNPQLRRATAGTKGNWMLPATHKQATIEIAGVLAELDTIAAGSFRVRAEAYCRQVDSVAGLVQTMFSHRKKPRVLAARHQAAFLVWLGFDTVATYGRPGEITARELTHLARAGLEAEVDLVVDNLQSGPDAGLELARSLGAKHVNLTNFPLDGDYLESLTRNANDLAAQLE